MAIFGLIEGYLGATVPTLDGRQAVVVALVDRGGGVVADARVAMVLLAASDVSLTDRRVARVSYQSTRA